MLRASRREDRKRVPGIRRPFSGPEIRESSGKLSGVPRPGARWVFFPCLLLLEGSPRAEIYEKGCDTPDRVGRRRTALLTRRSAPVPERYERQDYEVAMAGQKIRIR